MLALQYMSDGADNSQFSFGLRIDDTYPLGEAANFIFFKKWSYGRIQKNPDTGNDVRPQAAEKKEWLEGDFQTYEGNYNQPYQFYFSPGRHTIRLTAVQCGVYIKALRLYNLPEVPSYAEYKKAHAGRPSKSQPVILQGEAPLSVSDRILYPTYDRSSAATEPSDPIKLRLNTIGQTNWSRDGQSITWELPVKQSGYYKIAVKSRQNFNDGQFSTRRLKIDEKIPFQEAASLRFPFDDDWQQTILGGSTPYEFYLEAGKHTLTLEVVPGVYADEIRQFINYTYQLNTLYRQIIMLTGATPDKNVDYDLDNQVPSLMSDFRKIADGISEQKRRIDKWAGDRGLTAVLDNVILQLRSFVKKPYTIPDRMDSFRANISSLSAWVLLLQNQPLEIDTISVLPLSDQPVPARAKFFTALSFGIQTFWGSFTQDYSTVGGKSGNTTLTAWVNLGRDQVQVIRDMIDAAFTPQTGIGIELNLVQSGVIQATLAGKGPDIALMFSQGDPVVLAARGALLPLDQFPDFNGVQQRFNPQFMIPYRYLDHTYALPVTENFPMLFYRKDILNELGLKVPEDWDEFIRTLGILQRKHMDAGIPSDGFFDTLLLQNGGTYYDPGMTKTEFDQTPALQAFKQWTSFFRDYSVPLAYDFQNRFRTGEMPIGIAMYTTYNYLTIAAPEIKGMWDFTLVPGTRDANGQINRAVKGTGSCCFIFKKAEDRKQQAWQFLSWFTDTGSQTQLGQSFEALLGPGGRFETANENALIRLPWKKSELDAIRDQMKYCREIPQSTASYYVARNLTNAFRQVVYNGNNQREMLLTYNREINKEITRKRKEFGLD